MSFILGFIIFILDLIVIFKVLTGSGSGQHKLLWTLIILFLPVVGLVLYFLLGQSSQDAQVNFN